MSIKIQRFTSLSLTLAAGLLWGCPSDDGGDTGSTPSTGDSGSTGPGATGQDPTAGSSSSGGESSTGPVCENAGANGNACSDACDCMSNECFTVGALGGVCSDCDSDEDCTDVGFGCNFGNPLSMTPAVCSETGDLGEGCETSDACAEGLSCTTLIDVPGVITAMTCSECASDDDCAGQLCAPTYDIETIAGHFQCVDMGAVPNDEGCDFMSDTGNDQCMSGNCAPAAVMGIPVVGVCSPCNEDQDCIDMGMMTCVLPELAIEGTSLSLVPGQCM